MIVWIYWNIVVRFVMKIILIVNTVNMRHVLNVYRGIYLIVIIYVLRKFNIVSCMIKKINVQNVNIILNYKIINVLLNNRLSFLMKRFLWFVKFINSDGMVFVLIVNFFKININVRFIKKLNVKIWFLIVLSVINQKWINVVIVNKDFI